MPGSRGCGGGAAAAAGAGSQLGAEVGVVRTGGGGGALGRVSGSLPPAGLLASLTALTFLTGPALASSSDASVDDVNIFRCAFLNSAISMSCFSFLSVMKGAFLVVGDAAAPAVGAAAAAAEVAVVAAEAAFCFLRLISSWSAVARLPLLPLLADPCDSSDTVLPVLPWLLGAGAGGWVSRRR